MRKWNKLLALLLAMVMALSLAVTGFAAEGDGTAAGDYSGWDTIKVIETTDVHGWMLDVSTYDEATFQYRLAYISQIVNDARANEDYAGVLLLDTGDIYQGTPQSGLTHGAGLLAAFDVMQYDAVGLGNHEFDWDVDVYAADSKGTMAPYELGSYKGDSDIPVLACNVYDAATNQQVDFTQDYVVVDKGGYSVAILGYVDDYRSDIMASKINPYILDGDLNKLAARASEVKTETSADVLIILAHADPVDIAEAMDPEVVDLVVGGHTHLRNVGVAESGIPYIQGYRYASGYASADIKINPETKEVAVIDPAYISITDNAEDLYYNDGNNDKLDPAIVAISQANWEIVVEEYGLLEVLTTVDGGIEKTTITDDTTTTTAGNWMSGLMLAATQDKNTIAAFLNSGGIRTNLSLPEGADTREVTKLDIFTIAPFDNIIYVYTVTAPQLVAQLEAALQGSYDNSNYGDQFSGIVVEYYDVMENGEKTGIKVTKITTDDGVEIDLNDTTATYNIATLSYCATLDGSPLLEVEFFQDGLVDNTCYIDVLQTYAKANDTPYHVDNTVRAVRVEAPAAEPETPSTPSTPASTSFSDVSESNWHYEFVMKMAEEGVVNGYDDGSFKPNNSLTWGEALKMVVSYVTGEEKAAVEGGTWASGYIAYVQDNGIWTDEISQNATITREEMCVVLAKMLKVAASEKASIFPDTDNAYVMALVDLGIIDGIDGSFQPDGPLTRAQVCKILATIPEDLEPAEDETNAPAEAEDAEEPVPSEDEADEDEAEAPASASDADETEAEGDDAAEPEAEAA